MTRSPQLIVTNGPQTGKTFDLDNPPLNLGRDPRSAVVIDHPEVSRRHATIARTAAGWIIEDLDSTNGTFVNGEEVLAPRLLAWGDTVRLGDAVTLTFRKAEPVDDPARPAADRSESSAHPLPRATTHVGQPWAADRQREEPPPERSSLRAEGTPSGLGTDLAWVWIGAAFLALLIIAACAAALILRYLGLLAAPF